MVDWILENWRLFVTIPYIVFNCWLVYAFERDDGPLSNPWRVAMYLAGLWIVLFILLATAAETLGNAVERLGWRQWRNRPRMTLPALRVFAVTLGRLTVALGGLTGLYVASIASTGYRPSRFEIAAETFVIIVGAVFIVARYAHERENLRDVRSDRL